MIVVYLFIGILAAILSALPLGASNIAVINTTLKENAKQAFKIALTAGVAEVLLSYYALDCNTVIKTFFDENLWVQTAIVVLLFTAGGYLFFKKQTGSKPKKLKLTQSKYATGFLLGIINPPVLIYWVIAFGVLNNNDFMLSLQSSFAVLFLFFAGVYLGKLLTLYGYSKMSIIIKNKVNNISHIVNRVTGVLLIVIGLIQSTQLYLL
jgi:threonine/homoserine/homoserine lactone efflux protein